MPPPPKGKAPTKGAKQILSDNMATVSFYRNMSLGAGLFFNIISLAFYYETMTYLIISLDIFVILIYMGCNHMMRYISKAQYTESGQLVDPGLDLNMEGGIGEHIKDIVILASITHVMATLNSFFWLLLLLIPIRAMYLVWTTILGPWFFQEAEPEDVEQEEKKRRKMERRMKRLQH